MRVSYAERSITAAISSGNMPVPSDSASVIEIECFGDPFADAGQLDYSSVTNSIPYEAGQLC
jgi:hypothetical protein